MAITPTLGFTPDADRMTPGALVECSNLIPSAKGMKAAPSNIATSYSALTEAVTGSALLLKLNGDVRFIAGSASYLKEGAGGSWTNVSKGGGYSAGSTRWRFAAFGNDAIAANKTVALQRSTGSAFASLTAPKAGLVETVAGFVIVADFDDTGMGGFTNLGDTPDGWWCCGYNDVASWTPSAAAQSARGRLVDAPGPIRGLRRLGPYISVYKDRSIFLGSYVGAQAGVFQFNLIPGDIGCASHEAIANTGTVHLFPGENDFYLFDGSRPVEIGQAIRSWFFDRLDPNYAFNMASMHDRENGHVWWFYPNNDAVSGALNAAVVYDYRTKRWGVADRTAEMPIEVVLDGVTYGTLGNLYSTYGDLPDIPYGSPFWSSGAPVPALFDTDHIAYTLSGAPGPWSFKQYAVGDDQAVTMVRRFIVRWVTKPSTATMTNYTAFDAGDSMTTRDTISMNSTRGHFDVRASANWHQFEVNASGSAEFVGTDVDGVAAGAR